MNPLRAIENFLFRLLDRLIGINEPEIYSISLIDEPEFDQITVDEIWATTEWAIDESEPQQMTTDEIMLGILIAKTNIKHRKLTKPIKNMVDFKIAITFDGDVHFRRSLHRWKDLGLSFQSVKK